MRDWNLENKLEAQTVFGPGSIIPVQGDPQENLKYAYVPQKPEELAASLGVKYDQGKQKFDLLPWDLMGGEQAVWEFGAKKYAPMNWRKGMPMTRPFNACMRHLTAFIRGEDLDQESGESHLDHAICCIRMMQNTEKYFPELDDRYSKVKDKA